MPILPISPIMPIIPMPLVWNLPIGTIFLLPVLSRLIHFLLDTALLQEVALLPLNESTDKHIALIHLVNRAVTHLQERIGKVVRHVVDTLSLLECLQRSIVVVLPPR